MTNPNIGSRARTCPWWVRWYHRRQRQADVLVLLPALRLRAELRARRMFTPFTEDYSRDVERALDDAFTLHKSMPGQEHWRCACAKTEAI